MNWNEVKIAGNVTRDIELKYTPTGTAVAQVGMAVNKRIAAAEGREAREEVTFLDVTFFGRQAEIIGKYVTKGTGLFIEGELKLDRWEDRETSKMKTKLKVVGQRFEFTGGRGNGGGKHDAAPAPAATAADRPARREDDDDHPF